MQVLNWELISRSFFNKMVTTQKILSTVFCTPHKMFGALMVHYMNMHEIFVVVACTSKLWRIDYYVCFYVADPPVNQWYPDLVFCALLAYISASVVHFISHFLLVRPGEQQHRQLDVRFYCRCCIMRLLVRSLAKKTRFALTVMVELHTLA